MKRRRGVGPVGIIVLALTSIMVPEHPRAAPSTTARAAPRALRVSRVVYPPSRIPRLTLPDGSRRDVRSLLASGRLQHGGYIWDEAGVPSGPVWVRVDLSRQLLSVFRAGHEIGTAIILYGAPAKPTPSGVYPILERAQRHRSNLYDADMPYMLRLTRDGVAIHASTVRDAAATHGCIGVPLPFARKLFGATRKGDLVAIEGYRRAT